MIKNQTKNVLLPHCFFDKNQYSVDSAPWRSKTIDILIIRNNDNFKLNCTRNWPSKIYLIFRIPSIDNSKSNKNLHRVDFSPLSFTTMGILKVSYFERTFWFLQFFQKKRTWKLYFLPQSTGAENFRSFLGRIETTSKTFRS